MNRKITDLLLLAYTTWHVLVPYYGRDKEEYIHLYNLWKTHGSLKAGQTPSTAVSKIKNNERSEAEQA